VSIEDAIQNEERDPRDRFGLAGERVVSLLLDSLTPLDSHRVLCWDTSVQRGNTIEIDAVSQKGRAFLEIKWTSSPERMFVICAQQLLQASDIYRVGRDTVPRGVGIIVDCGPLVGKPPYRDTKTVAELVQIIESGSEPFSLCVLPYDEIVECVQLSPYANLLSGKSIRAAILGKK
jgi:hypothetical protein